MRTLIVFLFFIGVYSSYTAQITAADLKLAEQYYNNEEYEKAEVYYEVIAKEMPGDRYYKIYLDILTKLEKYKDAKKLVSKKQKKSPSDLELYLDMANIYSLEGEESKADSQYKKAIANVGTNRSQVKKLAEAFVNKKLMDYALLTYKRGREALTGGYQYYYETATLYGQMGDTRRMIDEYLELIGFNQAYIKTVQNALARSMDFTTDNEDVDMLKNGLLSKVQENPDTEVYYNFLIWLFTQKKDFNSAFVQTKAIDKRNIEDGHRLIALADLCTNNGFYSIAEKCYDEVSAKGKANKYYEISKMMALTSSLKALTDNYTSTKEDAILLDQRYTSTLDDLGRNAETTKIMREQADIKFKYLDDPEGAIEVLNTAITTPGVKSNFKAICKLDMADILLSSGYIWDASLYYSQVEKDYKNDVLGAEAKYRNAKISFYVGDFDWAQAQLDVLKASTSKLISNDAIDLSLLITDNLNLDTILDPMQKYAHADLLLFQNKYDEAMLTLDSINELYPAHSLEDEILFTRYEIEKKRGNFEKAAEYLQEIVDFYFDDILVDNALFELANMQEKIFNLPEKAMENYKTIMIDYPSSLFVVESRKRFRSLRGDDIN